MEVAGLAIGIVGLAGLFQSCLELISLIKSSSSIGRDYLTVFTKLELEKALMLQWARHVRLTEEDHDRRLDDPAVAGIVRQTLLSIRLLVEDSSAIEKRYGGVPCAGASRSLDEQVALVSKPLMEKFTEDFARLRMRTKDMSAGIPSHKKVWWALSDKAKFESLIKDLGHFVLKLRELFPDHQRPGGIHNTFHRRGAEDFASITSPSVLVALRDATVHRYQDVTEAVSERYEDVCRKQMLDILWFRSMDDRMEGVAPAHAETFRWALQKPAGSAGWGDLTAWLSSDTGQIYWVSGKAGSGKSTLMKYLLREPETERLLKLWAGEADLTVGSFFFWALGTPEQQSLRGLSRAILYQVLASEPLLIPLLLPHLWQELVKSHRTVASQPAAPSQAELATAFEKLRQHHFPKRKFCFLIDGLDEFSGRSQDAVSFIKKITANPQFKILLSSRPVPGYFESFRSCPNMKLQDLTRPDITRYVSDTLGSHPHMEILKSQADKDHDPDLILSGITSRSAGVFLWVVLACRSVLDGLDSYDRIEELLLRVEELPNELRDMFLQMLGRVEPRYQGQMAKLLQIQYRKQRDCVQDSTVYAYALGIAEAYDFDVEKIPHPTHHDLPQERCIVTKLEGRLRSRCGGLLQIRYGACRLPLGFSESDRQWLFYNACSVKDYFSPPTVEFIHRTVFELLDQEGSALKLLEVVDKAFNVNAIICIMELHANPLCYRLTLLTIPEVAHFAQLCDEEAPEIAQAVVRYITHWSSLWWRRNKHWGILCAYLIVALELGITNCADHYLHIVDEEAKCWEPSLAGGELFSETRPDLGLTLKKSLNPEPFFLRQTPGHGHNTHLRLQESALPLLLLVDNGKSPDAEPSAGEIISGVPVDWIPDILSSLSKAKLLKTQWRVAVFQRILERLKHPGTERRGRVLAEILSRRLGTLDESPPGGTTEMPEEHRRKRLCLRPDQ